MDAPAPPDPALAPATGLLLALSTAPPGRARELARTLVEEGLAACVSLVPGVRSLFVWQGELCDEPETLLLIKAPRRDAARLAARWRELHPYEVPEWLTFAPDQAAAAYLAWALSTSAKTPADGGPDAPGR